ncbi:MAG: hypothetical protein VB071_02030, partial [Lawsonibacter sp.]|nr:hypothetical protein [Lawsonibacter sp.]
TLDLTDANRTLSQVVHLAGPIPGSQIRVKKKVVERDLQPPMPPSPPCGNCPLIQITAYGFHKKK